MRMPWVAGSSFRRSITSRSAARSRPPGKTKSGEAIPTDAAARFLLRTYRADAGSSPTSTTASAGATPVDSRRRSTSARTSSRTFWATIRPSRITVEQNSTVTRSRGHLQAVDGGRPAALGIHRDDDAVQSGRSFGGLEARRHLGEEALDDRVPVDADDTVRGPGEPEVGDVGGAP